MLQLTNNGLALNEDLDRLRDQFASQHYIVLKNLIETVLLTRIQRHIERAQWFSSSFEDGFSGTEFTLHDPTTCNVLALLLNNPQFLSVISTITDCEEISEFSGRVYRMVVGLEHHLSWHNDVDMEEKRQIGFSLNLSTDGFRGSTFELRKRSTSKLLARVNNTGFGDALLFRISPNLQHRVTQVMGTIPKTACAGWFRATGKSYVAQLAGQLTRKRQLSGDIWA